MADMLVNDEFATAVLRSAIPITPNISYPLAVWLTRDINHSATPRSTGHALLARKCSSPVTSAKNAKASATSSEMWSSCQDAEPGKGAASSPDEGALSHGNC